MAKRSLAIVVFATLSVATTQVAEAQLPHQLSGDSDSADDGASPSSPPAGPIDRLDSTALSAHSPLSATAAEVGLASPDALSAKVIAGQSWARALTGYDSASQSLRVSSSAEAALTGRLVLRVDFEHGPLPAAVDHVSVGGRLQILNQESQGLDLGVGLFYQPNDFRRDGKIAAALLLDRRFGRLAVIGNAIFGSDTEGDDHEFDTGLSALVRVARVVEVGLDSRYRTVSSTDAKRIGTTMVDWDLAVLPTVDLMLGRFILIAQAGFSGLHETQSVGQPDQQISTKTGALVMSGLGAAF